MESLSPKQARRLVLHSQCLFQENRWGKSSASTLELIEHLGYVQIDTLAVVERAHNHSLWSRNRYYRPDHLDELQRQGKIYEHWAHALAYLPTSNYRFSLPLMQKIQSGQKHWYPRDPKLMKEVLHRINCEGALAAKDFENNKSKKAMWARSPVKNALEQLFMEGELMIPYRNNFQKSYDLRERVLPDGINLKVPEEEELIRFWIEQFINAHGLAKIEECVYLRKGYGAKARTLLIDLLDEGLLSEVEVKGKVYFVASDSLGRIDSFTTPKRAKILSPFDNSLIQRKRLAALFDFDYQIECYVPKPKRKFGYFCLPLLYGEKFVGRMDCKAERKDSTLTILSFHLEHNRVDSQSFRKALAIELKRFAVFNRCTNIKWVC